MMIVVRLTCSLSQRSGPSISLARREGPFDPCRDTYAAGQQGLLLMVWPGRRVRPRAGRLPPEGVSIRREAAVTVGR